MKTLIIQSYRTGNVPAWIARCLASVKAWAALRGYDYDLTDDSAFALCGSEYLAQVGPNMRSITNLCRLELIRRAHGAGYERAAWFDADVLIFNPGAFSIDGIRRYAFARETFLWQRHKTRWAAFSAANNSAIVCMRGEPDLDFLIAAIRHVAKHRQIRTNYQVGGDLVKGLRASLQYETLGEIGMFSHHVLIALARDVTDIAMAQARFHGNPVHAANLCAAEHYTPPVTADEVWAAMDLLEGSKGGVINRWLEGWSRPGLCHPAPVTFRAPDVLAVRAGTSAGPATAPAPPAIAAR